jgi:cytochrome P450
MLQPLMTSPIMQWFGGQTARDNAALVEYAEAQFKERLALEEELSAAEKKSRHKDLMHYLLNNADPKTGIRPTRAELEGDTLSLIGAGADTIATTLSALVFYLIRYPSTLQQLTAEIRQAFKSLDEIRSGSKMASCVYLDGAIEEALRMSPPVTATLPREVQKGGITIDDNFVPEGVVVGVPAYVVQHDEEVFPDPWEFRPERWIVDSQYQSSDEVITKADFTRMRASMCPFSLGSRGCVGKTLAYIEMRILTAMLLWSYDLEAVNTGPHCGGGGLDLEEGRHRADEFQLFDCFGAGHEGPIVRLRAR